MAWETKIITCNSYDEVLDIIFDENHMLPLILEGVLSLLTSPKTIKKLALAEVFWGTKEKYCISLIRNELDDTISKLISWLEKNEEYETCEKLINLYKGRM